MTQNGGEFRVYGDILVGLEGKKNEQGFTA